MEDLYLSYEFDESDMGSDYQEEDDEKGAMEDREVEYDSWDMLDNMCKEILSISCDPKVMWKCLQFCCLFPKRYEFQKDEMVQLWIAQDVFLLPSLGEVVEATGRLLFEVFEQCHVFRLSQQDYSTSEIRYRLNHSIVDLLQQQHSDEYIRIGDSNSHVLENTLHCSLLDRAITPITVKNLSRARGLCTLLILHQHGCVIDRIPRELFLKVPLLKVLDISHTNITELPSSIAKLKHLRYLNLSGTPITSLPDALCSLYEMQTLKLRGCLKLFGLPDDIRNLKKLRHLELDLACLLVSMPPGLGDLTELQSLPAFVVGKKNGCHITELHHLVNLNGTLRILSLENVASSEEAKKAALSEKTNLHKLELQWTELQDDLEVLENLKPHAELGELQIVGYGSARFSTWIGDPSFFTLSTIILHDCRNCELLPPLGKLPFLCDLYMSQMHEVKVIDNQFYGRNMYANAQDIGSLEHRKISDDLRNRKKYNAFPQLEKLTLNGLPKLEKWTGTEEGDFPCLKSLNVCGCSKLTTLTELSLCKSLQWLEISVCSSLQSFPDEGLPTSLQDLVIIDCPLLKEWCYMYDGENLARIPAVSIDYQQISQITAFSQTRNMDVDSRSIHSLVSGQTQEDIRHQEDSSKQIKGKNLAIVLPSGTGLLSTSLKQKESMHDPTSSSFDIPPKTSNTGGSGKKCSQVEEQVRVKDTGSQQHPEGSQRWVDPATETGPPSEGRNNWRRTLKWSNIGKIVSMIVPGRKKQSRNNTQLREFEISSGGAYMHPKTQPKASEILSDENADSRGATTGSISNEVLGRSINNPKKSQTSASESSVEVFPEGQILSAPKLRVYTFAELASATGNFEQDLILGEGAYGRDYKGCIDENRPTVIKKVSFESTQGSHKEWQSAVDHLGMLSHPNIVKLLGYCWAEKKELFLVYEYMQKGSLENHLFPKGRRLFPPLPWYLRLNIAIDAARGLAFLHASEEQVRYCNFNVSNILIDGGFNAKISGLLSDKNVHASGGSHVMVMSAAGYAAPEYMERGHLCMKSDVYGFGVVLLELVTGKRVIDTNRPIRQRNLVEWLKRSPLSYLQRMAIMDSELQDQFPAQAALQVVRLIEHCLVPNPRNRPSMKEVLDSLVDISTIRGKTRGSMRYGGRPEEWNPNNVNPGNRCSISNEVLGWSINNPKKSQTSAAGRSKLGVYGNR